MHAQLISYILNLAPIAPIVPMFFSALNSYVLNVSLALFVLSCSLLLPIKVNVFFWFGLVPSKRLKSGTKVITHVLKKFSKSSFVYDVLSVCNVMGSTTFPVFLAYLRFQSPSHLFKVFLYFLRDCSCLDATFGQLFTLRPPNFYPHSLCLELVEKRFFRMFMGNY